MLKQSFLLLITIFVFFLAAGCNRLPDEVTISKAELLDRVKGAWAGQTIGVTFGGPTEFKFNSSMLPRNYPITWDTAKVAWWFENSPGLYDDVYMDLTFVDVFEKYGLDADSRTFADEFVKHDYPLWFANQRARVNIRHGIYPPLSGHWKYGPYSDDIDFQIEADFAGIMAPGMPQRAAEICDTTGHLMNYGEGWYGGVFVASMYSLAIVEDNIRDIVTGALAMIPKQSPFYKIIRATVELYDEYPDDWRYAWLRIQQQFGHTASCPNSTFSAFNIDAKMNAAWIAMGLLYGEGDFEKTMMVSTFCGDDSDCNPGNAAGVLGAFKGYSNIEQKWLAGITPVEDISFPYFEYTLNDIYQVSFNHALQVIEDEGGTVAENAVTIKVQQPSPVRFEESYPEHYAVDRKSVTQLGWEAQLIDTVYQFAFDGVGFAALGHTWNQRDTEDFVFETETWIDGELVRKFTESTNWLHRTQAPFFAYGLEPGTHTVELRITNPVPHERAQFYIDDIIIYNNKPQGINF